MQVDLMAAGAFFLASLGVLGGFARWILTRVNLNGAIAIDAEVKLSAHKLHVAETYVTKAGMHEQTSQLMVAVRDVGDDVRSINERIDKLVARG